jgi:hypothetical protein
MENREEHSTFRKAVAFSRAFHNRRVRPPYCHVCHFDDESVLQRLRERVTSGLGGHAMAAATGPG